MAAPTIVLGQNQILLIEGVSKLGITLSNSDYFFAEVVGVNNLSELYSIGNFVLLNPKNATILTYDSFTYYLTTENNIIFKETV